MLKLLKRLFICVFVLLVINSIAVAQPRKLDEVKENLQNKDIKKAKDNIDAAVVHDRTKNLVEAWYLKGLVYDAVSRDNSLSQSSPNALTEAFEAYKKAYSINAEDYNKYVVLYNQGTNPETFIYGSYYQKGAQAFNNKKFDSAALFFVEALKINDYLSRLPNTMRPKLDTSLVVNIALAYENGGDKNSAATYYEEIADAKINQEAYQGIYRWLCYHYYKIVPDSVKLKKYIFIGKQIFPKDDFYGKIELDMMRNSAGNISKEELFAKYDAQIAEAPDNVDVIKAYCGDLFAYVHQPSGVLPQDYTTYDQKLESLYEKLLSINPEDNDVISDFAKHYYNRYVQMNQAMPPLKMKMNDINNKIFFAKKDLAKATKKTDKDKFNAELKNLEGQSKANQLQIDNLKAELQTKINETLKYALQSYTNLDKKYTAGQMKNAEKTFYKGIVDILITCYSELKDKEKVALFEERYSKIK